MRNRFKPFGGVLILIGAVYVLITVTTMNSASYQVARAFGGGSPALLWTLLLGVAMAITGVVLLTADPPPRVFQKLNRNGLIAFVILIAVLPFLFWLPWLVPALQEPVAPKRQIEP